MCDKKSFFSTIIGIFLSLMWLCNKVGLDVVSLSGWFVVCVIVSVDNERNIEVS